MEKYLLLLFVVLFITGCKKSEDPSKSVPIDNGLPKVQTNAIADFTYYSVILSGKLLDSAGSAIKGTGIVIDTIATPTTSRNLDNFTLQKLKDGSFSLTVTGLILNTTVYVRAYATNAIGTAYGSEIRFTTRNGKVFNGQVTLTNQQQVIDFGANHYTTINGDLTISSYQVTDLRPLIGLTVINNGLMIRGTQVTNFAGLDSLEETGVIFANDFWVEYNSILVNFSGLSKLRMSRGSVQIDNNNSLTSLDGLDSYIAASAGSIRIGECPKLQNVNGLKNLAFVGEDFYIIDNSSITDITGLANLSQVYGRLYIDNNASLTNLNGLGKIQTLPTGVDISNNAVLRDISGLGNLTLIGGPLGYGISGITINGNAVLNDLSAFNNITSVDYVEINNNGLLKNLAGFSNLQTVNSSIQITYNPMLSEFCGLKNLFVKGFSQHLNIQGNAANPTQQEVITNCP